MKRILDQSRSGLIATSISAVDLHGDDGNWATIGRRKRGARDVYRQREKRKNKRQGLRVETLTVGTMTRTGRVD